MKWHHETVYCPAVSRDGGRMLVRLSTLSRRAGNQGPQIFQNYGEGPNPYNLDILLNVKVQVGAFNQTKGPSP